VRRDGSPQRVRVDKGDGEPLGLELSAAVFDQVRTCDNHCPFCFIFQLPPGMRRSLSLRDDDYRLSFLYGNFTTLTRFTEADLERVVTERLGPLYVSIHATDPALRAQLLRNPRGAVSLRWLAALLDAGITVHGQIVVCPDANDGAALDDTLLGILDRYPGLETVAVVPVGVGDHSREESLRAHTPEEARRVLTQVRTWQARFLDALGRRVVYAADEYYLLAGEAFPDADAYDGFAQHENGIGMARTFLAEAEAALAGRPGPGTGPRPGFFAWVDGAPADGYRAPRATSGAPAAPGAAPVAILTGEYGAAVLTPLLPALTRHAGVPVRVLPVKNRFFGGNIAVTGLLTGADVADALEGAPADHRYLLPDVVLSRDRFLDDRTVADLPRPVELVATDGASLVAALA
ncbi:MAG TPA: DUF512 domain-containing protein, partial [Acidimicrobiia bacterium]|nr:DUF512 domain-containing protein [Acidimicrobiia bacterium]